MLRLFSVLLALWSCAALAASPLDALVRTLSTSSDPALQLSVLRGMNAGLKGKRNLPAPAGWEELYPRLRQSASEPVRQQAQLLAIVFGGGAAMGELRAVLGDAAAPAEARASALEALVTAQDPGALPLLLGFLREPGPLRRSALRALARFDDPQIAGAILGAYAGLSGDEKRDALAALARRPASARALLAAVDAGRVNRTDLTAPFARQLQDLGDPAIGDWLREHWGAVRTSSADKLATIAKLKAYLTPETLAHADANHGRALFAQTCSICHTLFGAGAKIGPELPGAFEDVDYLLQNVVDPNAIIGKDYQQTVVQMKKGETVIGIVGAQDSSTLTLKTLAGPVTVQRAEVDKLSVLEVSLMPEGLLLALPEQDVRDLFGYLRLHGQVPALVSEANLNDFNDDAAFERWSRSSPAAWKAENGVLTGHGSADRAEFVTSDFVSDRCQLEFDVKLTGGAGAEVPLSAGYTLRLAQGGFALSQGNENPRLQKMDFSDWVHCTCALQGHGAKVTFTSPTLKGEAMVHVSDRPAPARVPFTFRVSGAGGEFSVRKLRLALPDPKGG